MGRICNPGLFGCGTAESLEKKREKAKGGTKEAERVGRMEPAGWMAGGGRSSRRGGRQRGIVSTQRQKQCQAQGDDG